MKTLLRSLGGLSSLGAANLVAKGAWFAFVVVYCGHVLTPERYGLFATALSLSLLVAAAYEGGFYPQVVRRVASGEAGVLADMSRLLALRLLLGAAGVALTLALSPWIAPRQAGVLLALAAGGAYVTGLGVRAMLRGMMEAYGRLAAEGAFLVAERLLCIVLAVALMTLWEPSAAAALTGLAAGQLAVCLAQTVWLRRAGVVLPRPVLSGAWLRTTVRASSFLALAGLMTSVYYRSDQVIVERVLGSAAAGQYGLMYQILLGLNLLPSIVSESLLFPRFARAFAAGRRAQIGRFSGLMSGALFVLGLAVVLLVHLTADEAVGWAGLSAYRQGLPVLNALVWTFPVNGVHAVLNVALLAAGQERLLLAILAVGALVSVAGVLLFAPQGTVAVAHVTVAAEVVVTLGCAAAFLHAFRSSSPP